MTSRRVRFYHRDSYVCVGRLAMTRPRYLFMAMPPSAVLEAMRVIVARYEVDKQLGRKLFKPTNWHQSLSDRHWDDETPDLRAKMLRAGKRISTLAVQMTLNRIVAHGEHWAFGARGQPQGFADLLSAVHRALIAEGIDDRIGHTPHVTITYTAPADLKPPKIAESVDWVLDEVLLVFGGGEPYHYEVLGRWTLGTIPAHRQLSLF